ncbi:hypothetical protein ACPA9J_04020 [Pseudomonas aeruginosa]
MSNAHRLARPARPTRLCPAQPCAPHCGRGIRGKALPSAGLRSQVTVDPEHLGALPPGPRLPRRRACCRRPTRSDPAFPAADGAATDSASCRLQSGPPGEPHRRAARPAASARSSERRGGNLQPHDKAPPLSIVTRLKTSFSLLWVVATARCSAVASQPGEIAESREGAAGRWSRSTTGSAPADIGAARPCRRRLQSDPPVGVPAPSCSARATPTACGTSVAAWPLLGKSGPPAPLSGPGFQRSAAGQPYPAGPAAR